MSTATATGSPTAERLYEKLRNVAAGTSGPYSRERCAELAPVVDDINRLKRERNAVILVHYYVHPEITVGVGDFVGDSYKLAKDAKSTTADLIVFVAVRFMAETAKCLNPEKTVLIPSKLNGCSLADAISAERVRQLRQQFPQHTFVCYINTSAAVKALCDVCVTSSNVYDIVQRIENDRIYFLPDKLMGENVQDEMKRRGVRKDVQIFDATCYVHQQYDPERVQRLKAKHPGLKVLSHPECSPEIIAHADHVASTKGMMQYLRDTDAPAYLLLTECGLAGRAQVEMPGKTFIGPCVECRYMKSNSLQDVRRVLRAPEADDIVEVAPDVRQGALRCINAMFRYAEMAG
ncbi:MAG: quinolinate synthase NadA [Lentisphaerae bacterium]|nr:quinolinate synthase NadA [Lentisphaerota bacterium]